MNYLTEKKIETRNLFAGNIVKQPAYTNKQWRIADNLNNSDIIMSNTFFLGTYPGMKKEMLDYTKIVLDEFMNQYSV